MPDTFSFPYVPGPPSGDWVVTLPGDASIGEVLVYGQALVPIGGWLAYRAAVLADSPRYFLTFEDTGDRLADQTANGNDFTLNVGTPDYDDTAGPGGAPRWQANGATDSASLASAAWMATDGQTIEYWVKSPSGVAAQGALLARDGAGATNRWWISYKDSDDDWGAYSNNTTGPVFSTVADIADDGWHHVVWTWNWNSGVRTGAMYVDGVLDTSQTSIGLASSTAQAIQLGACAALNTRTDLEIALVSHYDYVLSAGQVSAHYDAMF